MIRILSIALVFVLFLPGLLHAEHVAFQGRILEDEEEFKLRNPLCVVVNPENDEIYVITSGTIHVFTSDLFPLFTLSKGDGIESATAMAFDSEGNFYVAQAPARGTIRPRISVLNRALLWERDIYFEGFPTAASFVPHRLAVDREGYIYVTGNSVPNAIVLDNNGGFVETISPMSGDREVRLNDVAVDSSGRIYVVSEELGHVYVYSENRQFLFEFGKKGGVSGKLSRATGVAADAEGGLIYITDWMRHTISVYNYSDGTYLFEFGGQGWGEGWFQYPSDLDVDSAGRVLIADTYNNRVEVFSPENKKLVTAGSGGTEAQNGE